MHRRIIALCIVLLLLPMAALCEEAEAPLTLRTAASLEEAESFVLLPPEDGVAGVQPGYIRYIAQHRANNDYFREAYWLGGEKGSPLDLTLTERYGHTYTFHASNMCTRAVYSMALSYLGVDVSPGRMSGLTGLRNMDPPYRRVSPLVGVELVEPKRQIFNTMLENYLTDPSYSPIYLYIRRPNGTCHALLVVAALPETSRFVVVDPAGMWLSGEQWRVYMISLNKARQKIVNSTFRSDYAGSQVLQCYQWRLTEPLPTEAPAPQ